MNRAILDLKSKMSLPLIAAPMFLVSGPDLVLAMCKQGIVGSFPAPNARTSEILDEWMGRINSELTAMEKQCPDAKIAPWAFNMVVHSSYDRLQADLDLVTKHRPQIVITALGSPAAVIEAVHGYGGLVFADVATLDFAHKAVDAGVDGLVLVGAGAGGHTGSIAGFAFVPMIREFFDGIVVLGGGICNGQAIRSAEILGADFAYMGTSLIAAEESMAVPEYKEMIIQCNYDDLILSNAFTGAHAYYMRGSVKRAGLDPDNLGKKGGMDLNQSQTKINAWKDVWSAGQGVGTVHQVEPAAEIVTRLIREYQEAASLPAFG